MFEIKKKNFSEYLISIWDIKIRHLNANKIKELMNYIIHYKIDKSLIPIKLSDDINQLFFDFKKIIDEETIKKELRREINKKNVLIRWNNKNKTSNKEIDIHHYSQIVATNEKQSKTSHSKKQNKKTAIRMIIETDFENSFWNFYPKKINKQDAFKIWKNLFGKFEAKTECYSKLLNEITKGLEHWNEFETSWKDCDGKFIMYPSKWLRNSNWEIKLNNANLILNI